MLLNVYQNVGDIEKLRNSKKQLYHKINKKLFVIDEKKESLLIQVDSVFSSLMKFAGNGSHYSLTAAQ